MCSLSGRSRPVGDSGRRIQALPPVSKLTFPARDGRPVSGHLRVPSAPAVGAAVVCHPHPHFGGNSDVWLLPAIQERLAAAGWAALRFDFRRDVGDGTPAAEDLAGAVDVVAGNGPVALVGWSFGALIGLLYGPSDRRVTHWVGIAPPTGPLPHLPMAPIPAGIKTWAARRTVILGEHEQFFADAGPAWPHATVVIPGADHFFFDRDDEVADAVVASLR